MPVDWVASQTERLSNIEELNEDNDKHNAMIKFQGKYLFLKVSKSFETNIFFKQN